jgi:putative flippase GtrA
MVISQHFFKNKQVFRFLVAGGVSAILGMSSIYIFTEWFHLWYLISSILSFLITFLSAFSLQKFWTFQNEHLELIPRQASLSLLLAGINFLINSSCMYLMVERIHLHYFVAQLLVYGFFAVFDFVFYKFVIFRDKEVKICP